MSKHEVKFDNLVERRSGKPVVLEVPHQPNGGKVSAVGAEGRRVAEHVVACRDASDPDQAL